MAGALFRDLSQGLKPGTEPRVFALADNIEAPLVPVGRLCKPYDNSDLFVEAAKDGSRSHPHCDDPPAQLDPELRDLASRFCT